MDDQPMCNCLGCQAHHHIAAIQRTSWERLEAIRRVEALRFDRSAPEVAEIYRAQVRAALEAPAP